VGNADAAVVTSRESEKLAAEPARQTQPDVLNPQRWSPVVTDSDEHDSAVNEFDGANADVPGWRFVFDVMTSSLMVCTTT